jgi:hypothetical protein
MGWWACQQKGPIMHSIIKPAIALAFGAALGIVAAAPALAQQYEPTSPTATNVGPAAPPTSSAGLPFANVNTPAPNGQCWVMNNKETGFGYWGECAGGTAPRTAARRGQARAHAAQAAVTGQAGAAAFEPTSPTATNIGPSTQPADAGMPFAYVNTPGQNGQCWNMNNKEMGFGYWGECAPGAQPTAGPRSRRQARR